MTYRLNIPLDQRRAITGMPVETQRTLRSLLADICEDPDGQTTAYGIDDPDSPVRMRTAGRGHVIAVVIINDLTITVSLVQATSL